MPLLMLGQVNANFTANQNSGCSPVVVIFQDLSTGNPTSWLWDFGNGNTSTLQNPTAVYATPGTYTVALTVSDGTSSDTHVLPNFITVYSNPTAGFIASDTLGCVPLNVSFTDQSTPGSGNLTNWLWDFGDGTTSNQQNPLHTYNSAGVFTVTLSVTNQFGCTDVITLVDHITVNPVPVAAFTESPVPSASCAVPFTVTFTDNSTGSVTGWLWDFGDGTTSTQQNPSHTYVAAGTYTVSLQVTNPGGCSDQRVKNNLVVIQPLTIAPAANTNPACENTPVAFSANASGNTSTYSYAWDFGDGGTSTVANPSHTYLNTGNFTVTLIVTSSLGCADTASFPISGLPQSTADFIASDTFLCQQPFTISFTDLSSPGVTTWQWDFGDGNTSSLQHPVHTYSSPGTYTVSLTVSNGAGCNDVLTRNQYIVLSEPVADLTADETRGCVPLPVQFTDNSTSVDPITGWQWDFGDGNTSNLQDPFHVYMDTGIYDVALIIITQSGCTDTLERIAYIQVGEKPAAGFFSDTIQCLGTDIPFTDTSSGTITQWMWDFGDGATSSDQNPIHAYNDTGKFTVTLIVSNNGCDDTLVMVDYITIIGPRADFSWVIDCSNPYTVPFTDQSQYTVHTWNWDFGDGTTSILQNPVHTFPDTGSYLVTLTVSDTLLGCTDDSTYTVTIADIQAGFSATNLTGCVPLPVQFTDLSTDAAQWSWDFGDGSFTSSQSPIHVYNMPGVYTVKQLVTDVNGCQDSLTQFNLVIANGVNADFIITGMTGCIPTTVSFQDLSNSPSANIVSWFWDFGDGTTSNLQHPTHIYQIAGNYQVTQTVTDSDTCTGVYTLPGGVNIAKPVADFSVQTYGCTGDVINFTNQSTGNGLSYIWDFGDGDTSSTLNPTHIYTAENQYSIQLMVTDSNGCADTLTRISYINIENPVAGYTNTNANASCPPLQVNFTDTSSGTITGWLWDFGDGATSVLQNPSHVYTLPGSYDVTLIVYTGNNCSDTITKPGLAALLGPSGTFAFNPLDGCSPLDVHFQANAANTVSYTWDFGDGFVQTTSTDSVTHTYTNKGYNHPILVLDDGLGCVVSVIPNDSIFVDTVVADFITLDTIFCNTNNVQFSNQSSAEGIITQYLWDFGDGTTSTASDPLHFYASAGSYDVRLTATTQFGCVDTLLKPQYINGFYVDAQFTADTLGCALPFTATFTDQSTTNDSIISWNWDFGDGNTANTQNPIHNYADTGFYTATLWVQSVQGCIDSIQMDISVFNDGTPAFAAPVECYGVATQFTDQSATLSTITDWKWYFGDGDSSTLQNPSHLYNTDGAYLASLIITTLSGCSYTTTDTVVVNPVPVPDAGPDAAICLGDSLQLQGSGGFTYQWTPTGTLNDSMIANPYASPTNTTIYTLQVANAFGCTSTDAVEIEVNPIPVANAGNDQVICNGGSAQLNAGGGVSYTWQPVNGLSSSSIPDPVASPVTTTDYWVTVTNQFGCSDVDTVNVTVNQLPVADAGQDTVICAGSFAPLHGNGGQSYQWSPPAGLNNPAIPDPVATPSSTQTYTLTVTDTNGCVNTDSVTITVSSVPVAIISDDVTICQNSSIGLQAQGGTAYQWSPTTGLSCTNCAILIASPQDTTDYTVIVSNQYCADTAVVTVNVVKQLEVTGPPDMALCIGDTITLEVSVFTETNEPTYVTWTPATSLGSPQDSITTAYPTNTTPYIATVSNSTCPPVQVPVTITVNPLPVVDAGPDKVTFSGMPVTLNGSASGHAPFTYEWMPEGTVGCTTCGVTDVSPTVTTEYTLTATDAASCKGADPVTVEVIDQCEEGLVYVPNAFTPNGDGKNDILYARGYGIEEFEYFRIFDRWGKLLFETHTMNIGWDGTYQGYPLNPGVFVYTVKAKCLEGSDFVKQGSVAILK